MLHAPDPVNCRSPLPEYVGATVDCNPHRRFPATRPHVMRLGCEHETQLSALLCGFDRTARINRFGHPASNACLRGYATDTLARADHIVGALEADRLIGVVELFAARRGVAELAFAIDAEWRRRGVASALLEVAKRWAEQAGVGTLRMIISRNNWPMRQFADKAGARLDLCLDEVFADIAVPTTASLDISAQPIGTLVPTVAI